MTKLCQIDGCEKKVHGRNLCSRHYAQKSRYGGIKRTKFDPNIFIFETDIVRMKLNDGRGRIIAETIFDLVDYDRIKNHKWCLSENRPRTRINGKSVFLSRFIMNPLPGKMIDHKNHDLLDNRRKSLRICSRAENVQNQRKTRKSLSRFKGVFFLHNGWMAQIGAWRKQIYLGWFKNEKEAAQAYDQAAIRYHGEFACLNFNINK